MKSVLLSIKPYYVFLIIARKMGWNILQEKTIEVRKDYPKDKKWNKVVHIYCTKDIKSFNLIPAQYQPLMGKFVGRVIGEFVCDRIYDIKPHCDVGDYVNQYECGWKYGEDFHCLSFSEMKSYLKNKKGYGWHISDLKLYDKPKKLGEFKRWNRTEKNSPCAHTKWLYGDCKSCNECNLTRPPQSWCYVESSGEY